MKLHTQITAGKNLINAYRADHVVINGVAYHGSLIVTADTVISPWSPTGIAALVAADLQPLTELGCPIVLLGTGERQRFPAPAVLRPLIERNIGVEVMDTGAACRTFNILVAEGRPVAAAIIVDSSS